ncbi:PAS domain-containing protein [Novosphingobium soli]|uniref:PAS domain-containing protein n=1 Tax=Novosphingobium soli TaxID=574956 RepID=A0ABV6D0X4_9SPHN
MDTGRSERAGRDEDPACAPEAEIAPGIVPEGDERRMQVRTYNFWAGLLDERSLPDIADLHPEQLPDFGPCSVLLDFGGGIEDPQIAWLGANLARECGAEGPIRRLAEVPAGSLLSRIADHYMQILASEAPIGFEADFVDRRGAPILYRGILLPFSRAGTRIDFVYGVISWKEGLPPPFDAGDAAHALDPVPAWTDGPLAAWADGPAGPGPSPAAAGLAERLASARDSAAAARGHQHRMEQALREAIGRAYDLSLAAEAAPGDFARLLRIAGIRPRPGPGPLVKLVFGDGTGRARSAEACAAIAHARRLGLAAGELPRHLAATPGGLAAVVREERRLQRAERRAQQAGGAARA